MKSSLALYIMRNYRIIILHILFILILQSTSFAQSNTALKYNGKFELAGMEVSNKDASGTGIAFYMTHGVDIKSKAFFGLGTGINYSFSIEEYSFQPSSRETS